MYNQDATATEPTVEEELRFHYNVSLAYPRGCFALMATGFCSRADLVSIFQSNL